MVGVALPLKAAGFLMEAELKAFAKVLDHPDRPLLAILGGAKIADKIPLIKNLLEKADKIIIGGGMAYTFHKVLRGTPIGTSLYDAEGAKIVEELVTKAAARNVELIFPIDFICSDAFSPDANTILPISPRAFLTAGAASTLVPNLSSSIARPFLAPRR